MDLSKYDVSQATHKIRCCHKVGRGNGVYYTMPCIILGETKSARLKIIVFGSRYWLNKEHIKRIRYISKSRVFEANK